MSDKYKFKARVQSDKTETQYLFNGLWVKHKAAIASARFLEYEGLETAINNMGRSIDRCTQIHTVAYPYLMGHHPEHTNLGFITCCGVSVHTKTPEGFEFCTWLNILADHDLRSKGYLTTTE